MLTTTETQLQRLADSWSAYAGEPVTMDETPNMIYGFASELGALRIFAKYQANGESHNPRVRVHQHGERGWFVSLRK